ncbi:MAG: hypothetical protein P8L79_16605 [Rhodospirillaceae bacterium]|jgi:hypothetical protein|nr:hypothetical protein [Rhodospirillaceae bacterium]
MGFQTTYLSATQAFDAKHYIEAIEIYSYLLETENDRLWAMIDATDGAKLVHARLAIQYAIHKTMIRRLQDKEVIQFDLSLFMRSLPVRIAYSIEVCSFLQGWKGEGSGFNQHKRQMKYIFNKIREKRSLDMAAPRVVDADVYASHWVVPDFIELETHLPTNMTGFVSLGCGCGMFDSAYLGSTPNSGTSYFIDIDKSAEKSVTEMVHLQRVQNFSFGQTMPGEIDPESFILSVRSCGFKYSVKTYEPLFRSLKAGGRALLDIAPRFETEAIDFFESLGATVRHHHRSIANLNLKEFLFE